jgi:hypothetical protein
VEDVETMEQNEEQVPPSSAEKRKSRKKLQTAEKLTSSSGIAKTIVTCIISEHLEGHQHLPSSPQVLTAFEK